MIDALAITGLLVIPLTITGLSVTIDALAITGRPVMTSIVGRKEGAAEG